MALIWLRHTRPAITEGVCYGATDLACAGDFETASATVLAGIPPVDRIISSPLRRCRSLAERVAAERAAPLTIDDRLRELAFGSWENRAWSKIARTEIDAWASDFHHARPHGGESVAMLTERVRKALQALGACDGTSLIVTHLGVIRAAMALAARADAWQARIGFGEWVQLDEVEHVGR